MSRKSATKLVVLDCDGVLVDGYVSIFIADKLGFGSKVRKIYAEVINGKKNFDEAVAELLNIFLGLEERIARELMLQIPIMNGAQEMIKSLKNSGVIVGVISTGASQYFLDILKEMFELDFCVGTNVLIKDGRFAGIRSPIIDMENKGRVLSEIASSYGIPLFQCAAVGDDASNISLFKIVGYSILFDSKCLERELNKIKMNFINKIRLKVKLNLQKRYIKNYVDVVINSRNLLDILNVLGI
ncbi:MAG: HAD-IB family phosphatase [Nitrososphaerota archaeon]|nr:HAD family phosphatase [Aigarchaeota archaeon]MDW8076136.1 HAD-IB family phosphatase [Nitrososphaerota archaeon]